MALYYPVLTLPFDIISQIFVYCLPKEDDALPWRTEAPLLLAGICRDWREVALCTHELWNTIHLGLRPHSLLKAKRLLEFWIPRAGTFPLSMSLSYKGDSDTARLGTLITQYAPHWSTIELHVPFEALLRLNRPPFPNFGSLERLILNCGATFQGGGRRVARMFSKAPRLRDLHIISGISAPNIALRGEQLTSLRLDNSTAAECIQTLAIVPNIVHFTSTLWEFGGNPSLVPPLYHLESLKIILSHTRGPALLTHLTLPALQHLELDLQGPPHEIERVTSLIVRSSCFLRRLSVRTGPLWTADHFAQLFAAIPSLEELEIRKAGKSADAVFLLLQAQSLLLPNLRSLLVERTISNGEDAELLADFLESRWNIPATTSQPVPLTSFRLDSPLTTAPDMDSDAVSRLRLLRVAGMSIRITSSHWSWFS
ncbi:hypothetical protein C8R44DRAFT_788134 [Mycena epipterygia]|nr:hypothetical protein C8R44DRAFT_788134 [Mycena epipterygia]